VTDTDDNTVELSISVGQIIASNGIDGVVEAVTINGGTVSVIVDFLTGIKSNRVQIDFNKEMSRHGKTAS